MSTAGKWLYDIYLDDFCVGNQGDEAFDTKEEAEADALNFINNGLSDEYKRHAEDFKIGCYQAMF